MNDSQATLQRRTLRVLFTSQILAGAGLAAGITVGALLAEEMLGSTGSAGLPAALFTLGAAIASLQVGRLSHRSGRRIGLATGYAVGAVGGLGVVTAAAIDSVPLLVVSLFLYGSGTATNLQARYAGADLATKEQRGFAVSVVLVATTLGAVLGPNLVEATGHLAMELGILELAGPFMLATVAYGLAGIAVAILLRPDPLLVARAIAAEPPAHGGAPERQVLDVGSLRLAAVAMVLGQVVMVAIMTMTPIHMRDHGHSLGAAGFVISMHIAAMYLPSLVTGTLVDRVGRRPVLALGAVTLLAAGVVAATAPAESVALLTLALVLLGLGWNFGLVAGSALVTDAVPIESRAETQGKVDLTVSLSGASGAISSGFVVAAASYAALSIGGGVLALALLPVFVLSRRRGRDSNPRYA